MEYIKTGLAISVGLIAVIWDLRYRKIPNWLNFTAIGAGIAINLIFNLREWYLPFVGMLLGFLFFFAPLALGGIGAGDVKLFMALGSICGPSRICWIMLYSALAGGLLALATLIRRCGVKGAGLKLYFWLLSLTNKNNRRVIFNDKSGSRIDIPYGVAIFAGLVTVLLINP